MVVSFQASKYLLDPLTAPGPSEETGPGTHYRSTFADNISEISTNSSKYKKRPSVESREKAHSSSPNSVSPRHDQPSHHGSKNPWPQRKSYDRQSRVVPTSTAPSTSGKEEDDDRRSTDTPSPVAHTSGRPRGSSLSSRFPGDKSHRPLEILRKETKAAHRSPHLRKKHTVGPDTIDKLDVVGGKYHHGGPYDATLLARNLNFMNSPVEALNGSNEETLKATPKEKIKDSIERHRPLDGVAMVPSGLTDRDGNMYHYEEGADLMVEADYKRWPGVVSLGRSSMHVKKADVDQKYLPEDLKGKGEPSYTIEKALKEQKQHRRVISEGENGIEMTSRNRPRANSAGGSRTQSSGQTYSEWEGQMRGNTTGRKGSGGLVKRIGSLRKRNNDT
ncbi:hypothetical protein MMC14_002737 [Varicellaria rhodocarpa]|nr:hypothetical protein [Varicellaria rhodocarpa]